MFSKKLFPTVFAFFSAQKTTQKGNKKQIRKLVEK